MSLPDLEAMARTVAEFYLGKNMKCRYPYTEHIPQYIACFERYKSEFNFLNADHKGHVTNKDILKIMNRYPTKLKEFFSVTKLKNGEEKIDLERGKWLYKEYKDIFEMNWDGKEVFTVLLKPKKGFYADNQRERYERLPPSTKAASK